MPGTAVSKIKMGLSGRRVSGIVEAINVWLKCAMSRPDLFERQFWSVTSRDGPTPLGPSLLVDVESIPGYMSPMVAQTIITKQVWRAS